MMAIFGGLIYPVLEIWNKTERFEPHLGYTLDGKRVFRESYPDAMLAAEWLETAPVGVMAEAVADQGGSYTSYNLISTFSGMPSVLGWVGHEHQWRGGGVEVGTRQQDLKELYSTRKVERVKEIIAQYHIRYIVFAIIVALIGATIVYGIGKVAPKTGVGYISQRIDNFFRNSHDIVETNNRDDKDYQMKQ